MCTNEDVHCPLTHLDPHTLFLPPNLPLPFSCEPPIGVLGKNVFLHIFNTLAGWFAQLWFWIVTVQVMHAAVPVRGC